MQQTGNFLPLNFWINFNWFWNHLTCNYSLKSATTSSYICAVRFLEKPFWWDSIFLNVDHLYNIKLILGHQILHLVLMWGKFDVLRKCTINVLLPVCYWLLTQTLLQVKRFKINSILQHINIFWIQKQPVSFCSWTLSKSADRVYENVLLCTKHSKNWI